MSKKAFLDFGNLVTPSLLGLYEELTRNKSVFSEVSTIEEAGDVHTFEFKNLPILSCIDVDWHRDWVGHTLLWVLESHGHIFQIANKLSKEPIILSKQLKVGDVICFNLDLHHRLILKGNPSSPLFVTLSWDLYNFQLPKGYKIKKWEDLARILMKEKLVSTGLYAMINHFTKSPSKSVVLCQWEFLPNSETEVLRECNKPLKTPYIWAKLSPYYSRFRVLPYSDQDPLNWYKLPSPRKQNYAKCKTQIVEHLAKHSLVQLPF